MPEVLRSSKPDRIENDACLSEYHKPIKHLKYAKLKARGGVRWVQS